MDIDDLKSLYLSEVRELYDCETRMAEVLPKAAMAAACADLRRSLVQHAEQTALHGRRAEAILRRHGAGTNAGADRVAAVLAEKAERTASTLADPDLRDAALIASVRRIGHHQVAAYGTAEGYAEALRLGIDRHGLLATLQEKKTADRRFAGLQGAVNQLALLVSPPPY